MVPRYAFNLYLCLLATHLNGNCNEIHGFQPSSTNFLAAVKTRGTTRECGGGARMLTEHDNDLCGRRQKRNSMNIHRPRPGTDITRTGQCLSSALLPLEVWTCFLPPFLGFIHSEYTVSYAYGLATALTGVVVLVQTMASGGLRSSSASFADLLQAMSGSLSLSYGILLLHSMALIFYGTRLNLFLSIRSRLSSRIQQINDNIERRAQAKPGNRFQTRTPFILACGILYYGLGVPLFFTSKLLFPKMEPSLLGEGVAATVFPNRLSILLLVLIVTQWFGFLMAAIGDLTKTWVKQSQKNESFLVTSGIFSLLRHPNYTGEIIGWTAHALVGFVAATALLMRRLQPSSATPFFLWKEFLDMAAMLVGWIGIVFVLLRATNNLEERQEKNYGQDPKYQQWITSTWSGWLWKPN